MEVPLFAMSREAGADLSTHQYKFVKLDSNGRVIAVAAATDIPCGILQNKPNALGVAAEIMVAGVSEVQADGALAPGDLMGTSADGQCDAKVAGTDTSNYIVGHVLIGASNAGERATVLFNCMNPSRGA
jgi:hypothetical protein